MGLSYTQMVVSAPFEALQGVTVNEWVRTTLTKNTTFCTAAMIYLVPVLMSMTAQVFPILSAWVRGWTRLPKTIVDIFEPLNRLFVGKAIHTPFELKLPYDFFWVSLLGLKFWFSYCYQISPLVEPTRDIWALDLSTWYPGADLGKTPNIIVLFVRWAPLMLMYMIDLQLWFMLWTAMYGTVVGCQLHIGEVPDL